MPVRPLLLTAALLTLGLSPVRSAPGALDAMDDALRSADLVILGEVHDDPRHHEIQAKAIRRMVDLGRRPTVVFEMIPTDLQDALDRHLAEKPGDVAGIGPAVSWSDRGWGDFAIYEPVFAAAVANGLPIRGGDLPAAEKRRLSAGADPLDPERLAVLGLDADLAPDARADLAETLRASHCGMLPETAIEPMILVQRARDGSMAAVIREAASRGPVVLIAGQGHARRDWGVPAVLARSAPGLAVHAVALRGGDGGSGGGEPFDAVVPTGPEPAREDPCLAFR
ncbi:ChaN family lipoprotein [Chthonobacter rhizosphaerae]|uniref:ChaN family lipoprotein n=1 Tax=Chthonobacter rhizosphaerae TaxID=2735553 RepID=UPI0015EFA50F|nr:ChaN family lipoprotein [Chthonobacter rhizosphaerae]